MSNMKNSLFIAIITGFEKWDLRNFRCACKMHKDVHRNECVSLQTELNWTEQNWTERICFILAMKTNILQTCVTYIFWFCAGCSVLIVSFGFALPFACTFIFTVTVTAFIGVFLFILASLWRAKCNSLLLYDGHILHSYKMIAAQVDKFMRA